MADQDRYETLSAEEVVRVDAFVSVRYFEFSRDFTFPEETHRCWEVVYLDKGTLIVSLNGAEMSLNPGDMILYPPMARHSILHNHHTAPNACGIAFVSDSRALYRLAGHIQPLSEDAQRRMARILAQAGGFSSEGLTQEVVRQLDPGMTEQQRVRFQLLRLYLEEFFLHLTLEEPSGMAACRADRQKTTTENARTESMQAVRRYIDAHLQESLTTEGLSSRFSIGKTVLCRDFKRVTGRTIKTYITEQRLAKVKQMIRLEDHNFTEIADEVGFQSLHYFSAWFKKMTGLTPTEYATSIQVKYR